MAEGESGGRRRLGARGSRRKEAFDLLPTAFDLFEAFDILNTALDNGERYAPWLACRLLSVGAVFRRRKLIQYINFKTVQWREVPFQLSRQIFPEIRPCVARSVAG